MLKKTLSLILTLALLAAPLVPCAFAAEYYSASTPLSGASEAKRGNVRLAVEAINGIRVPYGETFSFNETVGPRTRDRGFQSAPNGRGAKVTGGGVAQVATTLYLALMDVPGRIRFGPTQVYGSAFSDDYVDDGGLAVITDYGSDIDFSFTNLVDDMTIDLWMDEESLYCSIALGTETAAADNWFASWDAPTAAPGTSPRTGALIAASSLYCGSEAGVLHNVRAAADCVYDTTLASGDAFSFNTIVGPRTKGYGYRSGTNGRGVKVTGGGVAQVASAVWLAVKDMDDIAIIEKSTYGSRYNQDYVASSADAILTDYNEDIDFSFRYVGANSITLYTRLEDGVLTCEIYAN